jgi:hypothetical protein
MQGPLPKCAVCTKSVVGKVNAPGELNHGLSADLKWYEYGIPSGITYYIILYVDGKQLLRRSLRGGRVDEWRKSFDDMTTLIDVTAT